MSTNSNSTTDVNTARIVAMATEAAKQAADRETVKNMRKQARLDVQKPLTATEVQSVFAETELGDVIDYQMVAKGSTDSLTNRRVKPVEVQLHACMFWDVPGLADATKLIHIPSVATDGTQLDIQERMMALYHALRADGKRRVPIVTMSGVKSGNVYAVEEWAFNRLVKPFNQEKDGRRVATYLGLGFSQTAAAGQEFDGITVGDPADGHNGNTGVAKSSIDGLWWNGTSGQMRGYAPGEDGWPIAYAKGTLNLFSRGPASPALDTEMVKLAAGGAKGFSGKFRIYPTDTNSQLRKTYLSVMPILLLQDKKTVRRYLSSKVYREVKDLLSLITEKNRGKLSDRLGGLRLDTNGELMSDYRAVLDMLNSNIPWCAEIETRITRFMVRYIAEVIIPSGGIKCWESMIVISNEHGAHMFKGDPANAKCMMVRDPVLGFENVVFLDKDPWVKGVGFVVDAEVAEMLDGDADGDRGRVVYDRSDIRLFAKYLNRSLVAGLKPDKHKVEMPISADAMEDFVIKQWQEAWMVGSLTTASWKLNKIHAFRQSARMAFLAKIAPMLMKNDIMIEDEDGIPVPFMSVVQREYGEVRETLKSISLQWHDMQDKAHDWKSCRELAKAGIAEPAELVDFLWNAGVDAAKKWDSDNPMLPISMTAVKRLVFEAGNKPTPNEWAEAREMITRWGQYWHPIMAAGGSKPGQRHPIYDDARDWAKNASHGAIAAMLMWMPQGAESDGFGLKFHTVFAAGRGVEVLGYHPLVAEQIKAKRNWAQDVLRQVALVEAMVEEMPQF